MVLNNQIRTKLNLSLVFNSYIGVKNQRKIGLGSYMVVENHFFESNTKIVSTWKFIGVNSNPGGDGLADATSWP